ncbi:helix-turn-helix domain-containing protein [Paraburkholderia sp. D1E]|uniref:helix-turn-helix domain-containing protein n=1 Tax=Paraburkholderia sp. D1E TaxID=3461398 RepID=UPI004046490C
MILKAARGLVADAGFREGQMSLIADAAGIAVDTLYCYFPSKTELMVEIVKTTAQRESTLLLGLRCAMAPRASDSVLQPGRFPVERCGVTGLPMHWSPSRRSQMPKQPEWCIAVRYRGFSRPSSSRE